MIDVHELRQRIEGMYAEPRSDEGQAEIHSDGTHVTEVWEDGELTITKKGDLYRHRSLHQSKPPFLPEGQVLFPADDFDSMETYRQLLKRDEHKRMVVTDKELLDILAEYREFAVDQETIQQCTQDQ